jgi:hypothetical protein
MVRAAPRPSLMAQTTSDWPRRQSPAAMMTAALVANRPLAGLERAASECQ